MRGQRHRAETGGAASAPLRPRSTPPPPAKLPSKKWRDLILQVWHSDPLICPKCQHPMRVIAVIDQRAVIEKILRHLGQWNGTPPLAPARAPPDPDAGPWTREPCDDVDPMPACRAGRPRSAAQAGPTTKTSSPTDPAECAG